jgi:hypothetical protein
LILELNSRKPQAGAVRNWIAMELFKDSTNWTSRRHSRHLSIPRQPRQVRQTPVVVGNSHEHGAKEMAQRGEEGRVARGTLGDPEIIQEPR